MSKPKAVASRQWPEAVETRMKALFDAQLNENDAPMTREEMHTPSIRSFYESHRHR